MPQSLARTDAIDARKSFTARVRRVHLVSPRMVATAIRSSCRPSAAGPGRRLSLR
jgi:hypothetical protein